MRPAGPLEVLPLVELAEQLAPKLPPQLLRWGLHPRLLASYDTLAIIAAQLALLALPNPGIAIVRIAWWMTFVLVAALGLIVVLRWQSR